MTRYVVDASVAVHWLVDYPGGEQARRYLTPEHEFIAPDLILAEASNALWKYVNAGAMAADLAQTGLAGLSQFIDQLVPLPELCDDALTIALNLRHPTYDCFYLALASRQKLTLITSDKRLARLDTSDVDCDVLLAAR